MNALQEYIIRGEKLRQECLLRSSIRGISKLARKIQAEVDFLKKLKSEHEDVIEQRLKSSNLNQLQAMVNCLDLCRNVTSVLEPVHGLHVDIVCCHGSHWIKVLSRKPEALEEGWFMEEKEKNIKSQVLDLLMEAREQYVTKVTLALAQGVTSRLAQALHEKNVHVYDLRSNTSAICDPEVTEEVAYLDVSTMITLVTNMCHGGAQYEYEDTVFSSQASDERVASVLAEVEDVIAGFDLVTCESAVQSFRSIVTTLAGPCETLRAQNLLTRLRVVPDNPSGRIMALNTSGHLKDKAKIILGTGDMYGGIVLSANQGFVRAAANQGVKLKVRVHRARALSERREPGGEGREPGGEGREPGCGEEEGQTT